MTAEHAHALDAGGEGFTSDCQPTGCSCVGHRFPGVSHMVPCCDEPHIVTARPIREEFAVVIACLLAGRMDGQQAVASLAAIHDHDATTRQTAADTVLAEARRLCCGENPSAHHAATDKHSELMAFAGRLAEAVRGR